MLFRFSLYGFLKNQRYFEPFLVLAFLEKGLSFFLIGLLVGFRELWIAVLEVPSGAAADVWGRRNCLILSFTACVASFLVFGFSDNLPLLFFAMFLFAVGEAFRTGTHKAIIFSWLRREGRSDERLRFYGYTRSWSKIGSMASVVVAAAFVFLSGSYTDVFFLSVFPYLIGIVNFLGYPRELDRDRPADASLRGVTGHLMRTLKRSFVDRGIRRLVLESMGFEGAFHAVKDYLQPVLQAVAVVYLTHSLAASEMSEPQQAALLVGPVYLALYFAAAVASRNAHRLASTVGGEDRAATILWGLSTATFVALGLGGVWSVHAVLIAGFLILHVLQNLWRPTLISRFDAQTVDADGATVLSLESQGRRLATMAIAPALGYAIDVVQRQELGGEFWPIGAFGGFLSLWGLISQRRMRTIRKESP